MTLERLISSINDVIKGNGLKASKIVDYDSRCFLVLGSVKPGFPSMADMWFAIDKKSGNMQPFYPNLYPGNFETLVANKTMWGADDV